MIVLQQVPAPPPPPEIIIPEIPEIPEFVTVQTGPDFSDVAPVIAIVVLAVITAILLFPLIRAWARRIEGRGADPELRAEVEELRSRLAEVERHQVQVAELEERLDFAERLLAQHRAPDRIGPT
ncbi:MAG: hypothetical protein M3Y31_04565 [Gemmatimonadota bacterium]|nr:hypothetical protein [Gemmatimonadota bacterium]